MALPPHQVKTDLCYISQTWVYELSFLRLPRTLVSSWSFSALNENLFLDKSDTAVHTDVECQEKGYALSQLYPGYSI